MGPYVLKRLLWMVPTLIGISLVTFVLMEFAPGDRVLRELEGSSEQHSVSDLRVRAENRRRLMIHHGLIDSETGREIPWAERYWRWLRNAAVFEFAGSSSSTRFSERIAQALPVTLLLNTLALCLALLVAIPLGTLVGMRTGGTLDRLVSGFAFLLWGVPEFLLATLLVLCFGGGFFSSILPVVGLQSDDVAQLGILEKVWDLLAHLCLPVLAMTIGYAVVLYRFLRESIARVSTSDFVLALRGLGVPESTVRRRVLRNGLSPVITLLGAMLPTLVAGTVVVERVFSLPGIGWLTVTAVGERDMPMVMALTMLVATVTLVSLLLSDIVQRVIDPRIELR